MQNLKIRKEAIVVVIFLVSLFLITYIMAKEIFKPYMPKNTEYVVNKQHQEGHLTEKGYAPSIYFLQTNEGVYMVTRDEYYQTNLGDEYEKNT